jgi:transcriptional regulator with XRE-family HTH domain
MPRPTSRGKHLISVAVIQMRRELGMTQADLARALKVSLPTVGRWESWNPPSGSSLDLLARFASNRGVDASVFERALEEHTCPVDFAVISWEEAHQVHAFLETLRNPDFAAYRPRVLRALAPVMRATGDYVEEMKRGQRAAEMWIQQKLGRGPSDELDRWPDVDIPKEKK